jgi:ATP-dependent helicase HrpB
MQEFPAHPRLAHMLLKARELGAAALGAELAALLSDRDILRAGGGPRDSDVRTRLEALHRGNVDRGTLERVRRAQRSFEQQLGADTAAPTSMRRVAGLAYPDRIARRRAGGEARYQLANGRGAVFAGSESIAREEFIVAVDLDDREREARIQLAAPLASGTCWNTSPRNWCARTSSPGTNAPRPSSRACAALR